jgi:hypothetical protein
VMEGLMAIWDVLLLKNLLNESFYRFPTGN